MIDLNNILFLFDAFPWGGGRSTEIYDFVVLPPQGWLEFKATKVILNSAIYCEHSTNFFCLESSRNGFSLQP
ncbi:hypothetical protein [Staphylococcus argensis]|uniref:hypothetical protein n=1 Tax=Staphylococcus argensis TaxID=1607738 RepID=UPI0011A00EA7|nr:hypothetical protein [Staphylococcus argensis]